MKWGVRRYQNYDGSYTQAGVKRYHAAKSLYDESNAKYKQEKTKFKKAMNDLYGRRTKFEERPALMTKISKAKQSMIKAKKERKYEKKELNKAYKHLKQDKRADKGKQLYKEGKTITAGQELTNKLIAAGGSLSAIGLGMNKSLIGINPLIKTPHKAYYKDTKDMIKTKIAENSSPVRIMIGAGAALGAVAAGKKIYDYNKNKKLRAYYGPSGYQRGKVNKQYDKNKKYNRNEALRIVSGK